MDGLFRVSIERATRFLEYRSWWWIEALGLVCDQIMAMFDLCHGMVAMRLPVTLFDWLRLVKDFLKAAVAHVEVIAKVRFDIK